MKTANQTKKCTFDVVCKSEQAGLSWVCQTRDGKILLHNAVGGLSLVSACRTSLYTMLSSTSTPSQAVTRASYSQETDTLYFVQRSSGELVSDTASDTLWKVPHLKDQHLIDWSPEPVISAADAEAVDLQLFDCGGKVVCQLVKQLNTYKLFDLNNKKTWRYLNPHDLTGCKFIDASDYTLLVGSKAPTETNADRDWPQVTYVLMSYSKDWVVENHKKLKYLEGVSIEWITTVDRYVWIMFADCKLVVVDLQHHPSSVVVHERLDSVPLKVEVHHHSKKILLGFAHKLEIWRSDGNLEACLKISHLSDSLEKAIPDRMSTKQAAGPPELENIIAPYDFVLVEHTDNVVIMVETSGKSSQKRGPPAIWILDLAKSATTLMRLQFLTHSLANQLDPSPCPQNVASFWDRWTLRLVLCSGKIFLTATQILNPTTATLLRLNPE